MTRTLSHAIDEDRASVREHQDLFVVDDLPMNRGDTQTIQGLRMRLDYLDARIFQLSRLLAEQARGGRR